MNSGNVAMSFPIPATGTNPALPSGFTQNTSGAKSCPQVAASASEPGTLAAGALCQFTVSYAPALATDTSGWMVVTDASLNTVAPNYATQSAALTVLGSPRKPTVSWGTPASIAYGTTLSATQLNATASVAGTFSYSPAVGTLLTAGTYTLSTTFTPTDTNAYSSVTATTKLTVTKTTPAISWA